MCISSHSDSYSHSIGIVIAIINVHFIFCMKLFELCDFRFSLFFAISTLSVSICYTLLFPNRELPHFPRNNNPVNMVQQKIVKPKSHTLKRVYISCAIWVLLVFHIRYTYLLPTHPHIGTWYTLVLVLHYTVEL